MTQALQFLALDSGRQGARQILECRGVRSARLHIRSPELGILPFLRETNEGHERLQSVTQIGGGGHDRVHPPLHLVGRTKSELHFKAHVVTADDSKAINSICEDLCLMFDLDSFGRGWESVEQTFKVVVDLCATAAGMRDVASCGVDNGLCFERGSRFLRGLGLWIISGGELKGDADVSWGGGFGGMLRGGE